MPMKSIDVKIGQNSFNITTFGFCKGIEIQRKLIKLLSPFGYFFASNADDNDKSILDQEITTNNVHIFIEKICEKLDDSILDLIIEICSATLANNKELTREQIDVIFAGDYISMYKLIAKIIEVNNFLPKGTIGKIQLNQLAKVIVPSTE